MSLTVSSPVMIHLKSTLAVSVVMLAGLVAASPFPYPSAYEAVKPRAVAAAQSASIVEPSATPPVTATAWVDPPVQPHAVVDLSAVEPKPEAETPPTQFVALPPAPEAAAPAVQQPTRTATRQVSAQARAEQARRRKMARAAARERQAALRHAAPSETASHETPATAQRIDPIGDILRGLGLAKEG